MKQQGVATINELAQDIFADNEAKGFWDVPAWAQSHAGTTEGYLLMKKVEKICLMHSELSEALEGIRKKKMDEHCPQFTSEEVELADAMIRILDHAGGFGLRLGEAMQAKLAYNRSRPYKHGKKF